MLIYSMKPDHDGGVAVVDSDSQELVLAYEVEKDSIPRYSVFNPANMLEAAGRLDRFPEVLAISGWNEGGLAANTSIGTGYDGVGRSDRQKRWASVFGQKVLIFSSTHVLSHIWSSYGMSPYEQGKPCYALICEGALGDFYEIDTQLEVHHLGQVMKTPSNKYSFLYSLADPTFAPPRGHVRYGDPGKLMALCAYGESSKATAEEWELIAPILNHTSFLILAKEDLRDSPYYNIGVRSPVFTQLAKRFSDELFHRFERFARNTFDASKHFTRVLMQQGRVQLDADWNEQAAILLHYLQSLATDMIGPHRGPEQNLGFEIGVVEEDDNDFTIGTGRYYVQGILCENEVHWNADGTQMNITYENQPNYQPFDELPNPPFLIYLDVWERHFSYLEMENPDGGVVSIHESALGSGGPDTATRAQVVLQVKFTDKMGEINIPSSLPQSYNGTWRDWVDEQWHEQERIVKRQLANHGKLKASAIQLESVPDEPRIISPESRYRGAENQLYRVEIHKEGTVDEGATFKWSRENGSVIFPIREIDGNNVTLYSLERDRRFSLEPGNWVEIVDDDYTLQNQAGTLFQVETINYDDCVVTLIGSPDGNVGNDLTKHPILRRWDQRARGGVLDVAQGTNSWIDLEDGVQIQFQPGGMYYTGDYWLIPARTAIGDVEWPGPKDSPEACSPRGMAHHYAPIWIIKTSDGLIGLYTEGDLRRKFSQLWMLKPE